MTFVFCIVNKQDKKYIHDVIKLGRITIHIYLNNILVENKKEIAQVIVTISKLYIFFNYSSES